MKVVFFGNTKYSIIVLDALQKEFGVRAVVTKKMEIPNPVHNFAIEHNIQVQGDTRGADFFVVCDYGLILPKEVLSIPKIAALNVHHSLLPKYRGPSPAPFAILSGDTTTGVTIIKMNEKMDAGPILAQKEYEMKNDETTDSLLTKLNTLGAEILIPVINNYDSFEEKPQDEQNASYSKLFTKNDGYIDMDNPPNPEQIDRMIRAYYPWPGVFAKLKVQSEKLKIIKLLPNKKIQVEGKKPMSYKDFVNGYNEGKDLLDKLFTKV